MAEEFYFCLVSVCSIIFHHSLMLINWDFDVDFHLHMLIIRPIVCRDTMLRVDARQSAPKDGRSPLECFEVSC